MDHFDLELYHVIHKHLALWEFANSKHEFRRKITSYYLYLLTELDVHNMINALCYNIMYKYLWYFICKIYALYIYL